MRESKLAPRGDEDKTCEYVPSRAANVRKLKKALKNSSLFVVECDGTKQQDEMKETKGFVQIIGSTGGSEWQNGADNFGRATRDRLHYERNCGQAKSVPFEQQEVKITPEQAHLMEVTLLFREARKLKIRVDSWVLLNPHRVTEKQFNYFSMLVARKRELIKNKYLEAGK